MSSGVSQPPQSHQDLRPFFIEVFRRRIAHVAVCASLRIAQLARLPVSRAMSRPGAVLVLRVRAIHHSIVQVLGNCFVTDSLDQ